MSCVWNNSSNLSQSIMLIEINVNAKMNAMQKWMQNKFQ